MGESPNKTYLDNTLITNHNPHCLSCTYRNQILHDTCRRYEIRIKRLQTLLKKKKLSEFNQPKMYYPK